MDDLIDRYRRHLIRQGLADTTVRTYVVWVCNWRDWAADNRHDPADVSDELAVRRWSTTLKATEACRQQAIASMQHLADMLGQDRTVPGTAVERPRRGKPKNWRGLPVEVETALIDAAWEAGDAGTCVLVGLWTGLRRSEIAALSWEHIDLTAGRSGLLMAYRRKTDDWHSVPIRPRLRARLAPRHAGEGWVFPGTCGGHISDGTVNKWVSDVAKAAGVGHVTPHMLRHTAATRLFDATGSLAAAKELLGHQRLTTTQIYLRLGWRIVEQAMWDAWGDDDEGTAGQPAAA